MKLFKISWLIMMGFYLITLFSCENEIGLKKRIFKKKPQLICGEKVVFNKKKYISKDIELKRILDQIDNLNTLTTSKKLKMTENIANKFGSFIVFSQKDKSVKLISEVYIRNLKLASIKHEIYFIDDCNIITKMTKYAYRSKRIKAIYYFTFYKEKYTGCLVHEEHTLFHKKDKWLNISNEKIAKDWSGRIYNNIIRPHLFSTISN
jgi:hypothetical protein